jgi:hypothetical protein
VAQSRWRRFDVQAKWSVICALAALLPLAAGLFQTYRRIDWSIMKIRYGMHSSFMFALFACIALAGLLSAAGLALGINSAGQRRNEKQRQSWLGFFLGAAGLSGTIVLLAAFLMLRMPIG